MVEYKPDRRPMMMCGHRANATNGSDGRPCCVICAPSQESMTVDPNEPDLSNRQCICVDCKKVVPSTKAIAFFEHRPKEKYDTHYDGCYGWD